MHVVEPQAGAAPSVLSVADAGRPPVVRATEEEALCVAVEEAPRIGAVDRAACAETSHVAKEAAVRRQQEDGERRRRSKMVQNIAMCEKLGIKYRTKGATCATCRHKRLKKPSAPAALDAASCLGT